MAELLAGQAAIGHAHAPEPGNVNRMRIMMIAARSTDDHYDLAFFFGGDGDGGACCTC